WSLGVLVRELEALFGAPGEGRRADLLPALRVQFPDFAAWQRAALSGEALAERLDHWRRRLAGAPEALDLPTDRPRPPVLGTRGWRRRTVFPSALVAALEALGRREGATLFVTLLASFAVLLSRHSGQDDLVIGSPSAGRDRTELEDLIGCFVNTLAL